MRCFLPRSVFTILHTSRVVSYLDQCLQYCTLHTLFLTSISVYNTAHFTRCFLLRSVFTILHTSHVVSYFDQCLQYCTLHTQFLTSISVYNTAHFTRSFLLRSVFTILHTSHVVSYFDQCLQYCTLHSLFLTSISVRISLWTPHRGRFLKLEALSCCFALCQIDSLFEGEAKDVTQLPGLNCWFNLQTRAFLDAARVPQVAHKVAS